MLFLLILLLSASLHQCVSIFDTSENHTFPLVVHASPATVTSIADGYWDQAGTWDLGVPTIDDDVVIAHVVTIRDENAQCLSVTVNAGKQLIFECSGGATKIAFKDDANAKIVNSGTITIQNTNAVKKCTWAGGSSANKVDFQTQGTLNQADYWHWEYLKLSDPANFSTNKKIYIDKDIQTDSFTVTSPNGRIEVAAGVTWIVGHAGESGVDQLYLEFVGYLIVKGTSANSCKIKGTSATERMKVLKLYYGGIDADYLTIENAGDAYGVLLIISGRGRLFNSTLDATQISGNRALSIDRSFVYMKDCVLKVAGSPDRLIDIGYSRARFQDCSYEGSPTNRIRCTDSNIIDLISNDLGSPPYWTDPNRYARINFYSKLSLTVNTGETPLQNAYVSLIQDHKEDYGSDKDLFDFADGGYTDANGQVTLLALWKVVDEDGNAIYYSDENNNGPSGTKEKHLLKVTKEGYHPNQTLSFYMSQDRSATVYLTPISAGPYSLNLHTKDWSGAVLTGAVLYMNNGTWYSKTVDASGWGNFTGITITGNVSIYAKWQGVTVNSTFTQTMGADRTLDVKCKVWTLTLTAKDQSANTLSNTQLYWTFPNATQVALTNNPVAFKTMPGSSYYRIKWQGVWTTSNTSYTAVETETSKTVTCNVYKTVDYLVAVDESTCVPPIWTAGSRTLRFTADVSGTKTCKIYAGSLGEPESVVVASVGTAFDYDSTSHIVSFEIKGSSLILVEVYWGIVGEVPVTPTGELKLTIQPTALDAVAGTTVTVALPFSFDGSSAIDIVEVQTDTSWVQVNETLPKHIGSKAATIRFTVTPPSEGVYTCRITLKAKTATQTATAISYLTINATKAPSALPTTPIVLLAIVAAAVAVFVLTRRRTAKKEY